MKPLLLALAATATAAPLFAQDKREMDAHVHGVTTAEIAIEHGKLEIGLLSPGMDIVGFEYEASSAEDKDRVDAAIRQFLVPEEIVTLPEAAGCRLTEVLAHLHGGDHDDDDAHDEAHGDEHDHDHDHDKAEGDAHDHGHDHAEEEDHDHGAHEGETAGGAHSEFHVTYAFTCANEDALTSIGFPFFERFANAQEIKVQYVTETGAGTAELTPATPELTLE